jgi:hypothetical protein
MSELAEKLAKLKQTAERQLKECGVANVDQELLETLVNRLRTMINNKDATLVSGKDESELVTVRRNFVERKLGIMDKERAMDAIHKVVGKMSGIQMKSRPAFYYLVQQELT